MEQVRKHFRPELLNRLDEIVVFDPLSHKQLRKVARLQMKDVASRLAERGVALAVTDAALDFVKISDLSKIDIWYATFGSNMWKPRFLCYIEGGQVDGMQKPCSGSMDKSLPKEILWKTFPHRLFFGRESTRAWGSGGVAFLHPKSKNKDIVHMCLYRITLEQFNDVLLQENGSSYDMSSPLFDLTSLDCIKEKGSFHLEAVKKGWYRNVVYLGMQQDIPILTMTCDMSDIENFKSGKVRLCAPSEDYANTLVRGLVEGGQLSEEEAVSYIKEAAAKPL